MFGYLFVDHTHNGIKYTYHIDLFLVSVIGREVDYRSRLIYVRYCLTNTTLCL